MSAPFNGEIVVSSDFRISRKTQVVAVTYSTEKENGIGNLFFGLLGFQFQFQIVNQPWLFK
ncbi:hypothetical protein ACQP3L_40075, partial [Escherichia coli]